MRSFFIMIFLARLEMSQIVSNMFMFLEGGVALVLQIESKAEWVNPHLMMTPPFFVCGRTLVCN